MTMIAAEGLAQHSLYLAITPQDGVVIVRNNVEWNFVVKKNGCRPDSLKVGGELCIFQYCKESMRGIIYI